MNTTWMSGHGLRVALTGLVMASAVISATSYDVMAKSSPNATSVAVSTLHDSAELASWARRARDPIALIAAARLRLSVDVTEGAGRLTVPAKADAGPPPDIFEADGLLRDAARLAEGDKVVLALIADARSVQSRGVVTGPIRHRDAVRPQDIDHFKAVRFQAQREAAVYIQGDGKTDLDLKIMDEFGNVVCEQTGYSDRELCRWTPRFDGEFTIQVINVGRDSNTYWLTTN